MPESAPGENRTQECRFVALAAALANVWNCLGIAKAAACSLSRSYPRQRHP